MEITRQRSGCEEVVEFRKRGKLIDYNPSYRDLKIDICLDGQQVISIIFDLNLIKYYR